MKQIIAKPTMLKQVNLSHVRSILAENETATRAEIAKKTGISSTTVRAVLCEMQKNGEIQSIGQDASSGGRKAERYALCCERYLGVAFCAMSDRIDALLVNLRGEIVECTELVAKQAKYEDAVVSFLDELVKTREIKVIGLGLPGIVEGNTYWRKHPDSDKLYQVNIGDKLHARYGTPVVLENDINATTIGFGRCYKNNFREGSRANTNIAYLYFENDCISAGFLTNGQIVRGHRHFAGELGMVPMTDGKTLDSVMRDATDNAQYVKWAVQILSWVCAILNPEHIALGGPALRNDCIVAMSVQLFSLLPQKMRAELSYAPDVWNDYHEGMAYLTATSIFDSVRLVSQGQ